jgi:hypothetical protein
MVDMNLKPILSASFLYVLAACTNEIESTPTPNPERDPSTEPTALELGLPTDAEEKGELLSDDIATALMYDLSSRDRDLGAAALETVLEAHDERFIPVLIEVMRATEVGMFLGTDYQTTVSALETLSDESFGSNWPAWVEWYGGTELSPPPGFTGWKGDVLSFIDA